MKARVTIIGHLVKDAENFVNKKEQNQCKFTVAVNVEKKQGYYIDCFLNTHLTEQQLKVFKKGTLAMFMGRYNEYINISENSRYFNRTLNISDFYASKIRSPFYKDFTINLVGYLLDKPEYIDGNTTFTLCEKPFELYGSEDNKRYKCYMNYKISKTVLEQLENDTAIYVYGNYSDQLNQIANSIYIDRFIEVKDFEIVEKPSKNIKMGQII